MNQRDKLIRNLKRETSRLETVTMWRDKAISDFWAQCVRHSAAQRALRIHDEKAKA